MLRTTAPRIYLIVRAVVADSASSISELQEAVGLDVLCHLPRKLRKETNCVGRFNHNSYCLIAFSFFLLLVDYRKQRSRRVRFLGQGSDNSRRLRERTVLAGGRGIGRKPTGSAATAVDPTGGMTVNLATAAAHRSIDGQDCWFCCVECTERFDAGHLQSSSSDSHDDDRPNLGQ